MEKDRKGIEVAEFGFKHKDSKWNRFRRYIIVRQSIIRPKSSGKQLALFKELEEIKDYRFSLFITNDKVLFPEDVWREYRLRVNNENVLKELKEGYGIAAFNMNNYCEGF